VEIEWTRTRLRSLAAIRTRLAISFLAGKLFAILYDEIATYFRSRISYEWISSDLKFFLNLHANAPCSAALCKTCGPLNAQAFTTAPALSTMISTLTTPLMPACSASCG
jgi:hypothetical protein